MSEKTAVAERSFQRSDTKEYVNRGEPLEGPAEYIDELERGGLVRATKVRPEPETPGSEKRETKARSKKAG